MPAERAWSAEHSRRFSEHKEKVRGHVRYEITRHNLLQALSEFLSQPRRVLDIGGGEGEDAAWLAGLNSAHKVVLAEPDHLSLDDAKSNRATVIDDFIEGGSQAALDKFGTNAFDLVLSHGVIMYLADPKTELQNIASLVKPGGYLSLLSAGKLAKLERYRDDPKKVDILRLSGKYTNRAGAEATAYLPQEINRMLETTGFDTVDWFGVRLLSDDDNRTLDQVPVFELNRLLIQEIEAKNTNLRARGQMLHFIARKNP